MKLICYGDSNTFGYRPDGFFGGRYDEECRWVNQFGTMSGWQMINLGENGREIPSSEQELAAAAEEISAHGGDLFMVMLGTNDILGGMTARGVCAKMREFLAAIPFEKDDILIIAPPPMRQGLWVSEMRLSVESLRLCAAYSEMAQKEGIAFVNAAKWDIPLLSDGVHFTDEGHRKFARSLYKELCRRG